MADKEPVFVRQLGESSAPAPTPTPPPEEVAGLVERLRGLLAKAGFTRLVTDYIPPEIANEPGCVVEEGWRIHDFPPAHGDPKRPEIALEVAEGLDEAQAHLITETINALPTLLDAIASLSAQVAGKEEEAERQEELATVYRRAQLTAEEKLCREQANAAGWKIRAEHLEAENAVLRTGRQGSPSSLLAELTEEEGDELVKFVRSLGSPDVRAAVGLAGGEDGRG